MYFDSLEFVRDSGSMAYAVFSGRDKYFLRITKPAFFDTVHKSLEIHVFLMKQGFSVPPVIFTWDGSPCVHTSEEDGEHLYILYEFIEGKEVDPEQDAEAIGALLGKFHSAMKAYPGTLVKRDKYFYIGRYIDILREKKYPRAEEFAAYGEALWEKIRVCRRGTVMEICTGGISIRRATGDFTYWILIPPVKVFPCMIRY